MPTLYRETASLALKGGRREGDCQSGAKKRRESVGRRRRLPPKAEPAAEIPPLLLKRPKKEEEVLRGELLILSSLARKTEAKRPLF